MQKVNHANFVVELELLILNPLIIISRCLDIEGVEQLLIIRLMDGCQRWRKRLRRDG
jgi:hypothetical protein